MLAGKPDHVVTDTCATFYPKLSLGESINISSATVDCANCVVQKAGSLPEDDYSAIQASLVRE